jgi:hypothetical protein
MDKETRKCVQAKTAPAWNPYPLFPGGPIGKPAKERNLQRRTEAQELLDFGRLKVVEMLRVEATADVRNRACCCAAMTR